ncbi:MAG: hypothetical protein GTO03_02655, partial [Planctomycetales bacterium]|nr:hypothetical protein [Planctomycetales bacterium]
MPATEQTWRHTKTLHVVFGFSSIVMFVGTIWLLAADHYREWKDTQRTFHKLESWTLAARDREQQRADYQARADQLQDAVTVTRNTLPADSQVKAFIRQMRADPVSDQETEIELIEAAYQRLAELAGPPAASDSPADNSPADNSPADNSSADNSSADNSSAADNSPAEKSSADGSSVADNSPRTDLAPLRDDLLNEMRGVIGDVKFVEDYTARQRKFRLADVDALKSKYDLGVRDSIPGQELRDIQTRLVQINGEVDQLTSKLQATQIQRQRLQEILDAITHDEDASAKLLGDHLASRQQLEKALQQKTGFWPTVGWSLLQMPIIDAFGRPLSVNQIWLPELTLNNNFREVARFDRCTTCHTAIDKTAPGSAVLPGYPPEEPPRETQLATPAEAPSDPAEQTAQAMYGMELSAAGVIDPDDVVVEFVWPRTAAAEAGLERGDVITHLQVGQRWEQLTGRRAAERYLVEQVDWGKPISLRYRRGVPNPFSSHPRLDLFVGSLSPHKLQDFGCTICHEGQGSATQFKWASHTPNTPDQAAEWARKHGWFDNH